MTTTKTYSLGEIVVTFLTCVAAALTIAVRTNELNEAKRYQDVPPTEETFKASPAAKEITTTEEPHLQAEPLLEVYELREGCPSSVPENLTIENG